MSQLQENTPLTADDCYRFVDESVFRLRPSEYNSKYPKWPGQVGLEIEVLALRHPAAAADCPELVPLLLGAHSLSAALEQIAPDQRWNCAYFPPDVDTSHQAILQSVKLERGDQLSFEPGGQFEYSSIPYPCLSEALERLAHVQQVLDQHLAEFDIGLLQVGMNPWHGVDTIGLQMPKARYRAMDQYFSRIGPYGRRMMRQTCTVQVNLDFGADETTLAKRFLLGNLLAPVATASFANSPILDGQVTDYASFRSLCWRHIDTSRTGFPDLRGIAKSLSKKACVDAYFAYLLNAPVVFVAAADYQVPAGRQDFRAWLDAPLLGQQPKLADLETHLSLLFPEARPRGFIELRSVDAQARPWQSVPAAYYAGLMYDNTSLDQALDKLLPLLPELGEYMHAAAFGLRDQRLQRLSGDIMRIARDGLARLPDCFKGEATTRAFAAYAEHFTNKNRTPADDIVDLVASGKESMQSRSFYDRVHATWSELISQ